MQDQFSIITELTHAYGRHLIPGNADGVALCFSTCSDESISLSKGKYCELFY